MTENYPINSRFSVARAGTEFLVEDKRTGRTVSSHHTWAAALKARKAASEAYAREIATRPEPEESC